MLGRREMWRSPGIAGFDFVILDASERDEFCAAVV
jgi:hypothetical protein